MKYELKQIKGYDLVVIDGRKFLIDTGSSSSMLKNPVTINGRTFSGMNHAPQLSLLKDLFEEDVELIGKDIINYLRIISVNKRENTVEFGIMSVYPKYYMPIIDGNYVDVVFNGFNVRGFMDTGAPRFVADASILEGAMCGGDTIEQTFCGPVKTKDYKVFVSAGGMENKGAEAILHTPAMPGNGSKLYFSVSALCEYYYVIDLDNNKIYFE